MDSPLLHLFQQKADVHRLRDKERRTDDLPDIHLSGFAEEGEKILCIEDSPNVIELSSKDRVS